MSSVFDSNQISMFYEEISEISPPASCSLVQDDQSSHSINVVKIDNYVHIDSCRKFQCKDSSMSSVIMFTFPQCALPVPELMQGIYDIIHNNLTSNVIGRYIGCQEKHQDENLHAHIIFTLGTPIHFPKRLLSKLYIAGFHPNVMLCKNFLYSINYLTKDPVGLYGSDFFQQEFEQLKQQEPKELQKNSIIRNRTIFTSFKNGTVSQLVQDGVVGLKDFTFMSKGYSSYVRQFTVHIKPMWDIKRGIYIYGDSGVGKSTFAKQLSMIISKELFNDQMLPYYKNQSKWFDGYHANHVVILDDYDCGSILSHFLKIWTDWNTIDECVEVKGEFVQQNWCTFIVTSNYCIDQICKDKQGQIDLDLQHAIKRRFMILKAMQPTENYTCEVFDQEKNIRSIIKDGRLYAMNAGEAAQGNKHQPVSFFDWSRASK